jgi:hypothetical protein
MLDRVVAFIVDESKWLTASLGSALLAVAVLLDRHRHADLPGRCRVLAAMNLFFGVTIGAMAFGHLLAVIAAVVNVGLFIGSLIFLASGQSFEQFRGLQ